MKSIILLFSALLIFETSKSQITLENSYPAPSRYINMSTVNLANSGIKYVLFDAENHNVKLYNLNHSLWKTIVLFVPTGYSIGSYSAISETLFNSDGLIELVYYYTRYTPTIDHEARVINENGAILLTINNGANAYPVNTGINGWKLIAQIDSVNSYSAASVNVFSLIGSLPAGSVKEIDYNESYVSTLFPNPSNEKATIIYELPIGTSTAEIVLYNLNGLELKRYKVDNTFNTLYIDNSELASGTYLYNLVTSANSFPAKKMVVIK